MERSNDDGMSKTWLDKFFDGGNMREDTIGKKKTLGEEYMHKEVNEKDREEIKDNEDVLDNHA